MASQRHKTLINYYPSDCKYGSEGVASPSYRQQGAGPYTVPKGPAGGPLQGSSLAGPPPSGPLPNLDHPLAAMAILLSGLQPVDRTVDDTSQGIEQSPQEPGFTNAPVYPTSAPDGGGAGVQAMSAQSSSTPVPPVQSGSTPTLPEGRTFPMGPFNLVQVRYDTTLGQLIFKMEDAASGMVQDGDTVVISATGTTPVNGTYEATNVAGPEFAVDMEETPLTATIENKGRVMIVDGAP